MVIFWEETGAIKLVRLFAGMLSHSEDRRSLVRLFAGISLHSEDHHAHSTRSGKQRKIVLYYRIVFHRLP